MRLYVVVLSLLVLYISTCEAQTSPQPPLVTTKVIAKSRGDPADMVQLVEAYLIRKGEDHCKDNKCDHGCVNTLFNHTCVCDRGYKLQDDQTTCADTRPWRDMFTVIIIIAVLLLMIVILACCCCASFKHLKDNLLCKSFISWVCCITGCFCKVKDGQARDVTTLCYHDVTIEVSDYNTGEEVQELRKY